MLLLDNINSELIPLVAVIGNDDSREAREGQRRPVVKPFTTEEADICFRLVESDQTADELISDSLTPMQLWSYMQAAGKGLYAANKSANRLKPLLGRALLKLQDHPHLYLQRGFKNWNDFMSRGVWEDFGISRNEAYACKRVAEHCGFLSVEKMEDLGFTMLKDLSVATRMAIPDDAPSEMVETKRAYWVAAADELTVDQFRDKMASEGLITKGQLDLVQVTIFCTKEEKEDYLELANNPLIQAYCEGHVFQRMVAECRSTWLASIADVNRQLA